jgi:hypothetical protein
MRMCMLMCDIGLARHVKGAGSGTAVGRMEALLEAVKKGNERRVQGC